LKRTGGRFALFDRESPRLRVEIATGELRFAIALRGIHLNPSGLCADF
jgi:hypothetical protein